MIIRIHNFVTDIKLFSTQLNLIHLLLTTKLICIFYVVTARSGQLSAITVKAEIVIFLTRDWARTNHFVRSSFVNKSFRSFIIREQTISFVWSIIKKFVKKSIVFSSCLITFFPVRFNITKILSFLLTIHLNFVHRSFSNKKTMSISTDPTTKNRLLN